MWLCPNSAKKKTFFTRNGWGVGVLFFTLPSDGFPVFSLRGALYPLVHILPLPYPASLHIPTGCDTHRPARPTRSASSCTVLVIPLNPMARKFCLSSSRLKRLWPTPSSTHVITQSHHCNSNGSTELHTHTAHAKSIRKAIMRAKRPIASVRANPRIA